MTTKYTKAVSLPGTRFSLCLYDFSIYDHTKKLKLSSSPLEYSKYDATITNNSLILLSTHFPMINALYKRMTPSSFERLTTILQQRYDSPVANLTPMENIRCTLHHVIKLLSGLDDIKLVLACNRLANIIPMITDGSEYVHVDVVLKRKCFQHYKALDCTIHAYEEEFVESVEACVLELECFDVTPSFAEVTEHPAQLHVATKSFVEYPEDDLVLAVASVESHYEACSPSEIEIVTIGNPSPFGSEEEPLVGSVVEGESIDLLESPLSSSDDYKNSDFEEHSVYGLSVWYRLGFRALSGLSIYLGRLRGQPPGV